MTAMGMPQDLLESIKAVYARMDAFSPDVDGLTQEDLVHGYRGDFGIFAMMDLDGNAVVSEEEFVAQLNEVRTARDQLLGPGAGDRWLVDLIYSLERGCSSEEMGRFNETPEEAVKRTGPTDVMKKWAETLYRRIATFSDPPTTISKADLTHASRGDIGMFELIDTTGSGAFSLEQVAHCPH